MDKNLRYSIGTVQWGMNYGISNQNGIPDDSEVKEILNWANKNGINHLDTAASYANSEARIGKLITEGNFKFNITTKVNISDAVLNSSKSQIEKEVRRSIAGSLINLRLSKIDNVLLHRGEIALKRDMIAWKTLQEIKHEGKIGKIGFSALNPEEATLAFKLFDCELIQVASSLLDQRLSRQGFFEKCRDSSIQTFVRSTFLQGIAFLEPSKLTGKLKELTPTLQEVERFSKKIGVSPSTLWRKFAHNLNADFLVVGVTSKKELIESTEEIKLQNFEKEIKSFMENLPMHSDQTLDPSYWGAEESPRLFRRQ